MKETSRRSFLVKVGLALGVGAAAKHVTTDTWNIPSASAVFKETSFPDWMTTKPATPEFDPTAMTTTSRINLSVMFRDLPENCREQIRTQLLKEEV